MTQTAEMFIRGCSPVVADRLANTRGVHKGQIACSQGIPMNGHPVSRRFAQKLATSHARAGETAPPFELWMSDNQSWQQIPERGIYDTLGITPPQTESSSDMVATG